MNMFARLSYDVRKCGKPKPSWRRKLSTLDAWNGYCDAEAISSDLVVEKCGRFWNRVPLGTRSVLPKMPSVNISTMRPTWPFTVGVAPEVPPKLSV